MFTYAILGYADEQGSETLCKDISIAFGGSGYKNNPINPVDDAPLLLLAPVRISDNTPDLKKKAGTYGGAVIAGMCTHIYICILMSL
jgi:hypothetical protein